MVRAFDGRSCVVRPRADFSPVSRALTCAPSGGGCYPREINRSAMPKKPVLLQQLGDAPGLLPSTVWFAFPAKLRTVRPTLSDNKKAAAFQPRPECFAFLWEAN